MSASARFAFLAKGFIFNDLAQEFLPLSGATEKVKSFSYLRLIDFRWAREHDQAT